MFDKQKQLEERIKIQEEVEELSKQHKHVVIQWATGVGKGKAVMQCIAASKSLKPWLVVVPELVQIENYKEDLKTHGYDWMLGPKIIDIICYASLSKWAGLDCNLALNECHRITELKEEIVKTIPFDQVISDSATISPSLAMVLESIAPYELHTISMKDAVERGILPEPAIYKVPIKLDNKIRRNKKKTHNGSIRWLTDLELVEAYDRSQRYWENQQMEQDYPGWIKNKILQIGAARKKFLASAKNESVKALLRQLKDRRIICFCGSIEQAEDLARKGRAIHSKNTPKKNKEIIEQFNSFQINMLFTNKMSREGMNYKNIEVGIIAQLDSGMDYGLSFLQKSGRAMRSDDPSIYIIYAEGTQDEVYLDRTLQYVDKQYIKTLKLD